ncbi:internal scaffolding protein [Microviridae sp.]|nr:internal scaffolding protein [Microviridae sp.]
MDRAQAWQKHYSEETTVMLTYDNHSTFDQERPEDAHPRVRSLIEGETRTQQNFKDECDINIIVSRYTRGDMSVVNNRQPLYGDFTLRDDLLEAHIRMQEAEAEFLAQPASVRKAAGNNVAQFYGMLATEDGVIDLHDSGFDVPLPPSELAKRAEAQKAEEAAQEAEARASTPAAPPSGGAAGGTDQ